MIERTWDRWLLTVVVILCLVGLVLLYSSSAWVSERHMQSPYEMFVSQALKAAMGFGLMIAIGRLDYRFLSGRWALLAWCATTALLLFLVVPHPFKETIRHTDRWIRIGSISIQPSEFARVSLVVALAAIFGGASRVWSRRQALLVPLGAVVIPVILVLLQPNFGTATTMVLSVLSVLVLAGVSWRWLGGLALTGAAGIGLLTLRYPYPLERVLRWLDGFGDFDALHFQIQQGFVALGSGGLFGVGLGQSIHKRNWVPDPHTDLILAIVGEEMGFMGLLVLLALFAILIWRGLVIARRSPDRLGFLLAAGISVQIGLYVVINAFVVTGLLPVTGLPLPFVSYGGSALLANLASVGVLLSISRTGRWHGAPPGRLPGNGWGT